MTNRTFTLPIAVLSWGLLLSACDIRSCVNKPEEVAPRSPDSPPLPSTTQPAQAEPEPPNTGEGTDTRPSDTLSSPQIQQVIRQHVKQMRKCVEKQLKRDNTAVGKLTVVATIHPSGSVQQVRIDTRRFQGTYVEGCLVRAIKKWQFPSFHGSTFEARFPLKVAGR